MNNVALFLFQIVLKQRTREKPCTYIVTHNAPRADDGTCAALEDNEEAGAGRMASAVAGLVLEILNREEDVDAEDGSVNEGEDTARDEHIYVLLARVRVVVNVSVVAVESAPVVHNQAARYDVENRSHGGEEHGLRSKFYN